MDSEREITLARSAGETRTGGCHIARCQRLTTAIPMPLQRRLTASVPPRFIACAQAETEARATVNVWQKTGMMWCAGYTNGPNFKCGAVGDAELAELHAPQTTLQLRAASVTFGPMRPKSA